MVKLHFKDEGTVIP